MNITVLGATGGTGQLIVKKLLASGHTVTALVRSSDKLSAYTGKIKIVQGDVRDREKLSEAIAGSEAVISTLGPRSLGKENLLESFATILIPVMSDNHISRFISLSALGAGDSAPQAPLLMKIARKTILKNAFDDKDRAENLLIQSTLDYTFVRPGRLTNLPAAGNVRASQSNKGLSKQITRDDVADFMVKQLDDVSWLRKAPILGY